ncbi:myosin heavy chain isoform A, partial [Brachionus plicatilis]
IALGEDLYRLGNTKVFFRAGVLGHLEELRDAAISKIICMLQNHIRMYSMKKQYKVMLDQRLALSVLQRNIKAYLSLRNWAWWKLYTKVKPLLSVARQEDEMKAKEEEMIQIKETLEKEEKLRKELEETNLKLLKEKNELYTQLQAERDNSGNSEERIQKLVLQKSDLETQIKEIEDKLSQQESSAKQEISDLKRDVDEFKTKL